MAHANWNVRRTDLGFFVLFVSFCSVSPWIRVKGGVSGGIQIGFNVVIVSSRQPEEYFCRICETLIQVACNTVKTRIWARGTIWLWQFQENENANFHSGMVHSIRAVLALGVVGAGDFSTGVADFAAFPPRRNCSICSIRVFTCALVFAGTDPGLQTLLLLALCSLQKKLMVGDKFPECARFRIFSQWSRRPDYTRTAANPSCRPRQNWSCAVRFMCWHGPCVGETR